MLKDILGLYKDGYCGKVELTFSFICLLLMNRISSVPSMSVDLLQKFFTDQVRLVLGSGYCSVGCSVECHHAQKPQNCPISDLFNLTLKYLPIPPPYTDPVP